MYPKRAQTRQRPLTEARGRLGPTLLCKSVGSPPHRLREGCDSNGGPRSTCSRSSTPSSSATYVRHPVSVGTTTSRQSSMTTPSFSHDWCVRNHPVDAKKPHPTFPE